MSKHTPPPWHVGADIGTGIAIADDSNDLVGLACYGKANSTEEERAANALLMAAAPTLLDELTRLLKQIKETCKARKFVDGPLSVSVATANSLVNALKRKGVTA